MNFLLKIVEGPAKGAEVALIEGTRVKVGSSSTCDIVLPDASLAEEAFELDVSESTVTLITPDGTQSQLTPFEIRDFGTTAVAIGPADEPWGELVRPAPAAEPAPEPPKPAEAAPVEERKKSGGKLGFLWILILVGFAALIVMMLLLVWKLGYLRMSSGAPAPVTMETKALSIEEIAAQHGLKLERDGDVRILSGNLRRRAERLAIRALALASDPSCKLVLTDDQTMLQSCNDVLSVYSEGKVKAVSASNRVVWVEGKVASPEALERLLRAINEDVRGVERVDVQGVSVNGMFSVPTPDETREDRRSTVVEIASSPNSSSPNSSSPKASSSAESKIEPVKLPPLPKVAGRRAGLPFEGILTKPYPCVVLRDGLRILEGARVGTVTVVAIEADRLVLEDNGRKYEWRP